VRDFKEEGECQSDQGRRVKVRERERKCRVWLMRRNGMFGFAPDDVFLLHLLSSTTHTMVNSLWFKWKGLRLPWRKSFLVGWSLYIALMAQLNCANPTVQARTSQGTPSGNLRMSPTPANSAGSSNLIPKHTLGMFRCRVSQSDQMQHALANMFLSWQRNGTNGSDTSENTHPA
jgi:hypothetical protein